MEAELSGSSIDLAVQKPSNLGARLRWRIILTTTLSVDGRDALSFNSKITEDNTQ